MTTAIVDGNRVQLTGQLGDLTRRMLEDADLMFNNDGDAIQQKYNTDAKQAFMTWWQAATIMIKELNRQKQFEAAKFMMSVQTRGIECAYNYFGINPVNIREKAGFVVLSLCFYVIYTVWFGFSIMYTFLGLGFRLEH